MKELNNEVPNFDFFGELGERIKNYIRVEVKRKIEEFFEDYEQLKKHQQSTINSNELCKRWGRCKNSLRNLEKRGVIRPLSVGGKTKIYSIEDVENAELIYGIKQVA
ncbi:MAG: hypothetical protein MR822_05560 [Bacteroidales bacterium]|nr:hypothetical protein [Muribaculaceae bacterium]MCI6393936.1 hypothetical protein [Bacteroidales bacterium]